MKNIFDKYQSRLTDLYPDISKSIMKKAEKEYQILKPLTPQFKGTINIFNEVIGYLPIMTAFYKSMRFHNKTAEEAVKILYETEKEIHDKMPKIKKIIVKKFMFSRLALMILNHSAKKVRSHPEGWNIRYIKGHNKNEWNFECKDCGVIKYFKKHGVEELNEYCNFIDFIQSKTFDMGLENPKNIGQGDSVCLEYMKKGRNTKIPQNLTKIVNRE